MIHSGHSKKEDCRVLAFLRKSKFIFQYTIQYTKVIYIYKLCDSTNSQIYFAWNFWKIARFFHAMTGSFIIHTEHLSSTFYASCCIRPSKSFFGPHFIKRREPLLRPNLTLSSQRRASAKKLFYTYIFSSIVSSL